MLTRQQNFYHQLLQLVDAVLLAFTVYAAHALRYYVFNDKVWFDTAPLDPQFANCYWMMFVALVVGPLVLEYFGIYQLNRNRGWLDTLRRIAQSQAIVLLVIFACVVVLQIKQSTISRAALGLYFGMGAVVIFARVLLFQEWLRRRGAQVHLRQYILLCGAPKDRAHWKEQFLSQPGKKFEIKAEFDLREEGLAGFIEMLHEKTVDIVVFSLDERIIPQVQEALLACEAEGVEAWVTANFIQTLFTRVTFDQFAGVPLLIYRSTPAISISLVVKRLMDIVGSALLLIVTLPVMLLTALAIRLDSRGPVLFSQNRSGLRGRAFRMYKFRTMVTNAEQGRAELEDRNEMSGPVFKVKNDPRVTRVGHFLRKSSLDELPQLWNVLRGEMSLVGPRPLPLYETANFGDTTQRRRMSVRPGLTCLWQVRGRNKITDFKDWVILDLEYIDRWSLWLDFQILLRTVPVVLFGWGAK
jgi:exopolysaccharide biosynthesis polyprenyl glycosylphosphotransferase